MSNDLKHNEEVIYEWQKTHERYYGEPTDYRFVAVYKEYSEEPEIELVLLQERHKTGNEVWITQEEYTDYTPLINILRLIEHATNKKIKGSFT